MIQEYVCLIILEENMTKKNKRGSTRLECKLIQQRADKWCKDNGYPIQRSKYWQKRKWTHNRIYEQQ